MHCQITVIYLTSSCTSCIIKKTFNLFLENTDQSLNSNLQWAIEQGQQTIEYVGDSIIGTLTDQVIDAIIKNKKK